MPIGLVPLLFATVRLYRPTRDLAVVNWTCPVVVCDISCGQWDLSRCCLRHFVYIRDLAVVSGTCRVVFCSQLDLSRCCLQPIFCDSLSILGTNALVILLLVTFLFFVYALFKKYFM